MREGIYTFVAWYRRIKDITEQISICIPFYRSQTSAWVDAPRASSIKQRPRDCESEQRSERA